MAQSSPKTKPNGWVQRLSRLRNGSSPGSYKPIIKTLNTSSLSAPNNTPQILPNTSASRQIPLPNSCMLQRLVAHRLATSRDNPTWGQCQRQVLCDVASWLGMPRVLDDHRDDSIREHFVQLLLTCAKKKRPRDLPRDEGECLRLLGQWLRHNTLSNGKDVKHRQVYRLLAVDGFDGLEAKDLKQYVSGIWNPDSRRQEYRLHAKAVRAMYDWIDVNPKVSSLTGTDSACIVFLALLKLYKRDLKHVLMNDEYASQTNRAQLCVEGFLHRNANYYKDVRKVDDAMLDALGCSYVNVFQEWQGVGKELLLNLCNKRLQAQKVSEELKKEEDEEKLVNEKTGDEI